MTSTGPDSVNDLCWLPDSVNDLCWPHLVTLICIPLGSKLHSHQDWLVTFCCKFWLKYRSPSQYSPTEIGMVIITWLMMVVNPFTFTWKLELMSQNTINVIIGTGWWFSKLNCRIVFRIILGLLRYLHDRRLWSLYGQIHVISSPCWRRGLVVVDDQLSAPMFVQPVLKWQHTRSTDNLFWQTIPHLSKMVIHYQMSAGLIRLNQFSTSVLSVLSRW